MPQPLLYLWRFYSTPRYTSEWSCQTAGTMKNKLHTDKDAPSRPCSSEVTTPRQGTDQCDRVKKLKQWKTSYKQTKMPQPAPVPVALLLHAKVQISVTVSNSWNSSKKIIKTSYIQTKMSHPSPVPVALLFHAKVQISVTVANSWNDS